MVLKKAAACSGGGTQAELDQRGPERRANRRGRRRAGGRGTRAAVAGWERASGWGDSRAEEQEEGSKVPAYRKALRKKQRAPEIGARGGGRADQHALRARPRAALCTVRFERGTARARIFFHPLVLGLLFRDQQARFGFGPLELLGGGRRQPRALGWGR